MKKLLLLFLFTLFRVGDVLGQTKNNPIPSSSKQEIKLAPLLSKADTIIMELEELNITMSLKNRFKLFKTNNIYTFLQLDTKTGRIRQVQWSLESEKEGSVAINDSDLSFGIGYGSGSFELYPTENMYQFILIDKTDGRKWHVQWGMEEEKRWIRRILDW